MKKVNVGLIGMGTVGTGVAKALLHRSSWLAQRAGVKLVLKKVSVRNPRRKRSVALKPGMLVKRARDLVRNPEIDIVVELMGGHHPARELVLEAIRSGKHVVTANKALLAHSGAEIFKAAKRAGVDVQYEASVAGAIPIIKTLQESLVANELHRIYGIINGTANFILSEMEKQECSFKAALAEAQKRGYAERNPALDIRGIDSAHKLSILSLLAFGKTAQPDDIFVDGIASITPNDIRYARSLGYAIRLLAIAKRRKQDLELRVHPTLLPERHPLALVSGVHNAVYVKGDMIGDQLLYGQGAGRWPTTSAVLADLVDVARNVASGAHQRVPAFPGRSPIRRIRKMGEVEGRYYLRFSCIDKPGVLSRITQRLGAHQISIASVIQLDRRYGRIVPLVMITHEAKERNVQKALAAIDRMAVVRNKTMVIRMERG